MSLRNKKNITKQSLALFSNPFPLFLFLSFGAAIALLFSCDALVPGTACVGLNEEKEKNIWEQTTGQDSGGSSPLPIVLLNALLPTSSGTGVPCSAPALAVNSGATASVSQTTESATTGTGTTTTTDSSGSTTSTASTASSSSSSSSTSFSTGSIDTTFGTAAAGSDGILNPTPGVITIDVGGNNSNSVDAGTGIGVQSTGKIIIAGNTGNGTSRDLVFFRFNSNGTLDRNFGTNGKFQLNVLGGGNNKQDDFVAVKIQSDNKIVALANVWDSTEKQYIIRLTSDGALDTSFDTDGIAAVGDFVRDTGVTGGTGAIEAAVGYSLQIDSNGKILTSGTSAFNNTGFDASVSRLNSNGSLDTGFGVSSSGKRSLDLGAKCTGTNAQVNDDFRDFIPLSNGKVIAGGEVFKTGDTHDLCFVRFNSDGSVDTAFGGAPSTAGFLSVEMSTGFDSVRGFAVDSSGNVFVAAITGGAPDTNANSKFSIVKMNGNGVLDTSFGSSNGKFIEDFGTGEDISTSVFLQSDGKILLSGYATINAGKRPAMMRVNANGTLDSTFGTSGKLSINSIAVKNVGARNVSVAQDSSGNIYLVGTTSNDNIVFAKFN